MYNHKIEFKNPEEYFPYIGHDIDHAYVLKDKIYEVIIGNLLEEKNIVRHSDDLIVIDGKNSRSLFKEIRIKGFNPHIEIAKDKKAVELYIPRHRSLFDYIVHMPIHLHFITPRIMFLAGNNLFVSNFDSFLRKCGGFMYLREDSFLKRKGYKKTFLSKDRYIGEIFPAYIKQQMFQGTGKDNSRLDLVIYPESEKDPVSRIRKGGRTKSGKLRVLSPFFFEKLKAISKDFPVKLYITAMNISFSKVPEAPYIVHPSKAKGIRKKLRYFIEQYFTMFSYPKYALSHPDAKLEALIHYGQPHILSAEDFTSVRDLLKFSKSVKEKIGMLESIFPVTFLYRVLDNDPELSLSECEERMKKWFEYYFSIGVDLEKVSESKGNMLPAREIIERSVETINANPSFYVKSIKKNKFLEFSSGRIVSHDHPLQAWYANNIMHLDMS